MNASLIKLIQDIRGSYWFLPTWMALAAIGLSFVTYYIDSVNGAEWLRPYEWLYYNQADGARATLTTIAGSMITVAGVTFSMTMVAVSFASAQFGPRLIGNFMRDRGNQITLGTFISTFVYSLLILRTVRGPGEDGGADALTAFIPNLSVLTAIVLALASVAVLIYFIHHIPETINIGNITANLGRDLRRSVQALYPEESAAESESEHANRSAATEIDADSPAEAIEAIADGYLQAIDRNALLEIAREHDVVVRIQYRPGDFVVSGAVLAQVRPEATVDEALERRIRSCFALGLERTSTQDTLFLADQLVEIMVRALSPGVNDPFTALNCIDWLRAALHELARREIADTACFDDDGKLRVLVHPISFERFASAVYDQSRQYVSADLNAALRMMSSIAEVGVATAKSDQRKILMLHATHLAQACETALPGVQARKLVAQRFSELQALLTDGPLESRMRDDQGWLGGRA